MKQIRKHSGFTLIELVLTIAICAILVFVIGVVMIDTQRGWMDTYAKVHGGASADAMMAKTAFERIVRKASYSTYDFNAADDITVYYYEDWLGSAALDRYSRFYRSQDNPSEMYLEHGTVNGIKQQKTEEILLSGNVVDLEFKPVGSSIEIKLALDDGREATTMVAAAILHNE